MGLKRKQIVILSLVLMIIIAGYIQYNYKRSSVSTMDKETGKLGEAVFVDSNDSNPIENTDQAAKKDTKASQQANDYFTKAKMDKDVTRSKDKESLEAITKDDNAAKEIKDKAYTELIGIIADSEKEMKIETLVKKIGFEDVVALIGEDNIAEVIVKAPIMTEQQRAQITDIVTRQAKITGLDNIIIKNLY